MPADLPHPDAPQFRLTGKWAAGALLVLGLLFIWLASEYERTGLHMLSRRGEDIAQAMRCADPARVEREWQVQCAWIDHDGAIGGALAPVPGVLEELRALTDSVREREANGHHDRLVRFLDEEGRVQALWVRQDSTSILNRQRQRFAVMMAGVTGLLLILFLGFRFLLKSSLSRDLEALRTRTRQLEQAKAEVERNADDLLRSLQELSHSKAQAESAARTKTEFLANMSHEIRTPLTAMMGYADLLLDADAQTGANARAHLQTIRSNGEHLLAIINDILDISKAEAGRMQLERMSISLDGILQDVLAMVRAQAQSKGLKLHCTHRTDVPEVIETDPTRMRQILINLIGNAVKFTDQGSVEIAVSHDADTQRLRIAVCDTGIGISAEELPHLFQPFMQADASTTRRFGGTGLGLAISRRLARMLGGDIEAESRPGAGSCFTLSIPVRVVHSGLKPAARTDAEALPGSLLGVRVLVAEDGRDNQRLISLILERAGAQVDFAVDGEEAVERALSARPYDVILMDMQMPVLDGYEATRRIRAAGCQTPLIAVTAHAMAEDRQRCIEAGCDDFAAKPIRRPVLLETISRWRNGRAPSMTQIY